MKYKLTFALVAALTGSAFAAFQAPLPEFKNEKQLAEWRAEQIAKSSTQTATDETAFYTGKPYIESSDSYAFKYRSYNPELVRWTSADPSGFPDGANQSAYGPNPLSEFDFGGLFSVDLNGKTTSSSTWTNSSTLRTYTVSTTDLSSLSASNFSGSLAGWNFTTGSLDGTMKVIEYEPFSLDGYGKGLFLAGVQTISVLPAGEQWGWVQIVTCNTPGNSGKTGAFLDNIADESNPFYRGKQNTFKIFDHCRPTGWT